MIKLQDAQITDIMPNLFRNSPEVRAISYALAEQTKKIYSYAQGIRLLADVDHVPEKVLDLMAIECQALYYDSSLPIETKRKIMRGALATNAKAGTIGAMNELIQNIFGTGEIEEWFEYDGTPFCFRIVLPPETGTDTPDQARLRRIIENVKNARSKLESLIIEESEKLIVLTSETVYREDSPIAGDGTAASIYPVPTMEYAPEDQNIVIHSGSTTSTDAQLPASTYPSALYGFTPSDTALDMQLSQQGTTDAQIIASTYPAATQGFNVEEQQMELQDIQTTTTDAQTTTDSAAPDKE